MSEIDGTGNRHQENETSDTKSNISNETIPELIEEKNEEDQDTCTTSSQSTQISSPAIEKRISLDHEGALLSQENQLQTSDILQSQVRELQRNQPQPQKPPIPVLKSSLKSSINPSFPKKHSRPSTARRVGGLWNDALNLDCHFRKLRDETIARIISFLNLADMLTVGTISQRYRSIVHDGAQQRVLWHTVDATEFVSRFHAHALAQEASRSEPNSTPEMEWSRAQKETGRRLEQVLKKHNPKVLILRNIHNRLSADSFLPSFASLQELELSHFQDLSDTHAHVLLLLLTQQATTADKVNPFRPQQRLGAVHPAAAAKTSRLKRLFLTDCPQLGDATIRSISSLCPSLKELSLAGCWGITNIEPIAPLVAIEKQNIPSLGSTTVTSSPEIKRQRPEIKPSIPNGTIASTYHTPASTSLDVAASKVEEGKEAQLSLMNAFAPPSQKSSKIALTNKVLGPLDNPQTGSAVPDGKKPEKSSSLMDMFAAPQKHPSTLQQGRPTSLLDMFAGPQAQSSENRPGSNAQTSNTKPTQDPAKMGPNSTDNLAGMFLPPTEEAVRLKPLPTRKTQDISPSPSSNTHALKSLFAPPGSSPKAKESTGHPASHTQFSAGETIGFPLIDKPTNSQGNSNSLPITSRVSLQTQSTLGHAVSSSTPQAQMVPPISAGISFPGLRMGTSLIRSRSLGLSNALQGGQLQLLDISRTDISAASLLKSLDTSLTGNGQADNLCFEAAFHHLSVEGSSWTDATLERLSTFLSFDQLQTLVLESHRHMATSSMLASTVLSGRFLTDTGIQRWVETNSSHMHGLRRLNLCGHGKLTFASVGFILENIPSLEELRCRRIAKFVSAPGCTSGEHISQTSTLVNTLQKISCTRDVRLKLYEGNDPMYRKIHCPELANARKVKIGRRALVLDLRNNRIDRDVGDLLMKSTGYVPIMN